MELPKFHETFLPVLETLKDGEPIPSRNLALKVRDNFYSGLPKNLLDQKTSTGANMLLDRILWAKSYLKMGNYVSYPKRAYVQITEKGKNALQEGTLNWESFKSDKDFIEHRQSVESQKESSQQQEDEVLDNASPQDLIDSGFTKIENEVKRELLELLKEVDPYYFEKIILKLLQKMGYGDFVETSKSNDGGIDGIINEDKLGLEKIYTQAKRYSDAKVRETDIRNFIGAMSGDTRKGVFITTSSFDEKAIQKAKEAHHSIVLIDGGKLVDLMHHYNVGVQVKTTYEIKTIDSDFFE